MLIEDLNFRVVGPRLTHAELNQAEVYFGVSFPDDYRRFLLHHNGGYTSTWTKCTTPYVAIGAWHSIVGEKHLDRTNGLDSLTSLIHSNERLRAEFPALGDFMCIADDYASRLLVYKLRGPGLFRLGLWDWELEWMQAITLPFESLSDLLTRCVAADNPYDESDAQG